MAAVARRDCRVDLDPGVLARLARARSVVERYERDGRAVYALTRGLGSQVTSQIEQPARDDFSRAVLFARIASIACGGSGGRALLAERLVAMLNAGVHPRVPSIGSVGAADLAPLANLALPLIGEGRAEVRGETLPGAEAMARAALPR